MKKILPMLIFVATFSNASTNDSPEVIRTKNKAHVAATYKSQIIDNKGKPDILILPGLEANRKTKEIHVWGEATGLKAGEVAEYFLTAENSGHDYETVVISFALPSDVRKALMFIGMEPGRPVDYNKMQFWPKGERVIMSFKKALTPTAPQKRAENFVKNTKTGKLIPEMGFVFTGSLEVTSRTNAELKALAADVFDPMSIAANYNESDSILDLPRLAKQNDVYESQVISDIYKFKQGELIDIIIEPEFKDGKTRVSNLNLKTDWITSTNNQNKLAFNLLKEKKPVLTKASFPDILAEIKKIIDTKQDPFVTVEFADNLPLHATKKICSILGAIDSENGIRIEAPVKGQLYYKSFTPEKYLYERKNRIPLKWEMHIKLVDNKVKCRLTNINSDDVDNEHPPKITDYEINNNEELIKILNSKEVGIPVMLVFSDPNITYKQLMNLIQPIIHIYNVVHIFIEVPA